MPLPNDRQYEPKEAYDLGFEDGQEDRRDYIEELKDKIEDLEGEINKFKYVLSSMTEVDYIERDIISIRDKLSRL